MWIGSRGDGVGARPFQGWFRYDLCRMRFGRREVYERFGLAQLEEVLPMGGRC